MAVIRSLGAADRFCDTLRALLAQHGAIEADAKPWKPTRSSAQNNYLFGVCYPPLADAMGYTPGDIHEYMLGRHFGWADKPCPKTPRCPEGIESVPVRTTTKNAQGKRSVLKKMEFSDFIGTVHRIAAQAGVFIPDPDKDLVP